MKKLLFVIVSILTMVGFTSCESVSDAKLIGRWDMQTIELLENGKVVEKMDYVQMKEYGVYQIWEFAEDNKMYVSVSEGGDYGIDDEYAGKWSLEGNLLHLEFIPIPVTVSLSSSTLILKGESEGEGFRYTFKKLK